ncbi:50S ribosomal protein L3 N(5)-glutamine methyltransferase [Bosea sp. SSUT16]|jgi:ribosomal protein L3 glutamine methyltransferase|uniref:50S ribosomal protein L3 N(5)-glutamine methyltransferase n=1 Tax=Bosea spartocytisi TaxID=2773451 RepID=A0A927I2L9_9HYPH|nr:50S ribosomal protein L3 N(5)-glutamine methyltransferase [Bosea spartocytisi]MBD3848697.1 50S ribosomal protein L3 N(5)-glutamine methyltransferase [Bosea spartocytisi]MCT4471729.1 50S ribosomal protein L3 N(5)-glutamine methyltransferase [Bosea spartocytisi]
MTALDDLLTLRDLLRYAVSRFNAAGLSFGHGTTNALDEAAFLLLEALKLPVDDINPWLDAHLTRDERACLLDLIEARVTTRKPAPYLVGRAYIHGLGFRVDERVIVPRSYIGELLMRGVLESEGLGLVPEPEAVGRVLDLCTGSACLAIIAAGRFPNAEVDAVELSPDALDVARLNVADYDLGDRVHLLQGDLFAPLDGQRYDLIIANPPYVTAEEVAAFPPEYASEPQMAHIAGADGLDLVHRILAQARNHLNPGGGLLCEVGTGREALEAVYDLPFTWLDTEESEAEVFWIGEADLPG